MTNKYDYTAFGQIAAAGTVEGIANRYQYTGREASQLASAGAPMFYRWRMYQPQIGRFLWRDPTGYPNNPDGNLYAYCSNSVTMLVDPMGLSVCFRKGSDDITDEEMKNFMEEWNKVKNSKNEDGTDTEAAKIIKKIEENDKTNMVYVTSDGKTSVGMPEGQGGENNRNLFNGEGVDTITEFKIKRGAKDDPDSEAPIGLKHDDGSPSSLDTAIAHEVQHIKDYNDGNLEAVKLPNGNFAIDENKAIVPRTDITEQRAMSTENQYRKSQGIEQRKYYSDKNPWPARQW